MTDFDSPWKEALEKYFEPFIAFLFSSIHGEIDWSRGYEFLDKELQQVVGDAEQGMRVADKLVRVWRKDGRESWVLIHVEVQSHEEASFAKRMYVYHYRLFDRYDHQVVSLAILGDDNPQWRPSRFGYDLWGCRLRFDFRIAKLLDYRGRETKLAQSRNPFAIITLAHLRAMETRNDSASRHNFKVQLVKSLYDHQFQRADVLQLFRLIDWMMTLPEALNEQFRQEIWQYQEQKRMPYITSIERSAMKKGHREGRREGRREGLLVAIELALEVRFGAKGTALMETIRNIEGDPALREIIKAINSDKSLDNIRELLPDS
jgi:hypothetical protein